MIFLPRILIVVFSLMSSISFASSLDSEIRHILSFVTNTDCLFERNGSFYKGQDATIHIIKKYNYFKDEIYSTERFIELSATKSTISGKYYLIHCLGKESIRSQDWLNEELKNFRKKTQTQ